MMAKNNIHLAYESPQTEDFSPRQSNAPAALVCVFVHGFLWGALLLMMVLMVPQFTQIFAEFDVELPAVTALIVNLSNMLARDWYLAAIALPVLLVLDFFILLQLADHSAARRVWHWGLLFVPILLGGLVLYAVFAPLTELINDMR